MKAKQLISKVAFSQKGLLSVCVSVLKMLKKNGKKTKNKNNTTTKKLHLTFLEVPGRLRGLLRPREGTGEVFSKGTWAAVPQALSPAGGTLLCLHFPELHTGTVGAFLLGHHGLSSPSEAD